MRVKAFGHVWECVCVIPSSEWSYTLTTTDERIIVLNTNASHSKQGENDVYLENLVKYGYVDFDKSLDDYYSDYYLIESITEY